MAKCIDRKSVGISSSNEESINALPSAAKSEEAVQFIFFFTSAADDQSSSLCFNHCRHMVHSAGRSAIPLLFYFQRQRDGTRTAIQHEAPFVQRLKCMLVDDLLNNDAIPPRLGGNTE